jgi:hypothetical protein
MPMAAPKRIQVTVDLATQSQAAELNAAWQEILAGQRLRLNTAAEDLSEIMERARTALPLITHAVETNPGAGQSRRLVRFLAGLYNGSDFPFDLTDLRSLDTAPRPHFSSDDNHESRLFALAERNDRQVDEFVREALEDFHSTREAKIFGGLLATQPSPDGDRPLIHARNIDEAAAKALCGATDGPWSARGFDFLRLSRRDCQSHVPEPPDDPA